MTQIAQRQGPKRRQLFNGRDLTGWEHVGPGEIVVDAGLLKTRGGMGLLWYTSETFGDCVFFREISVQPLHDRD